jgi:hypothetical protein
MLATSIWLFRKGMPFWAGFFLPLVTIKPPIGLAMLLFALPLCFRERRWWHGCVVGALLWYGLPTFLQADWPFRWLRSLQVYASPESRQ